MRLIVRNASDLDVSQLKDMVEQVNGYDGSLENLEYYENDEYFFSNYFSGNVMEAVRAVSFGDYNYSDDFVKFDSYGNLETCTESEYEREIENYADEIVEEYMRLVEDGSINDSVGVIDEEEDLDIEDDE